LNRRGLTNALWRRIEHLVPGKVGDRGRSGEDSRRFVDAELRIARSAAPWRDFPEEFASWNSSSKRIRREAKQGVWESLFVRVARKSRLRILGHRLHHCTGASARGRLKKGSEDEAIGRSRGGLRTKINVGVDALGIPLCFILTAG
jgi:transposase